MADGTLGLGQVCFLDVAVASIFMVTSNLLLTLVACMALNLCATLVNLK